MLKNYKGNLKKMSEQLNISEILCRILVNRGIVDLERCTSFIKPELSRLHNPRLMKDLEKGVGIIKTNISRSMKILVIGDYDVDGVISTYLLYTALKRCGADVEYEIPHRTKDGYGINTSIIENAKSKGINTIITCDNGISAIEQIKYAKDLGLTVIITDHHQIPFIEGVKGERIYVKPDADAIINPKQIECNYPFKELCGSGVAFKFIDVLYEKMGIPKEELNKLIEYVAIATVCDVVDMVDENRILVKNGLELINNTDNIGLRALIKETGIEGKKITAYSFGFIIGPCINASGRLDSAKKGVKLLLSKNENEAKELAEGLSALNRERKDMTVIGTADVEMIIEKTNMNNDKVFVIYKSGIHESIAGIIAGRIKDKYHRPTFVLTTAEVGVKGSGRSIDNYNMFEELIKCKDILIRFGGHPMAAGLSLEELNIDVLRTRLNKLTLLSEEDLIPKVYIDMQLSLESITLELANDIEKLEPFGKANPKPLFAEKNVKVMKMMKLGKNKNVLKLVLITNSGNKLEGIYFNDILEFEEFIKNKFGEVELYNVLNGRSNNIKLDIIFNIDINEYMGNKSVQLVIKHYR